MAGDTFAGNANPMMGGTLGGAMPEQQGQVHGSNMPMTEKVPMQSGMGPQRIDPLVRTDRAISSQLPPKVEASNG